MLEVKGLTKTYGKTVAHDKRTVIVKTINEGICKRSICADPAFALILSRCSIIFRFSETN